MDLKTEIKEISLYGKEICLQNLLLASKIIENLKKNNSLDDIKRIEKEIIIKYENIYSSFEVDKIEKIIENEIKINETKKILESIKNNLDKILKNTNLSKDFIVEQMEIRKKLKNKSGAEVIKKFYEYKLKEYNKIKLKLIEKINNILDEEEKLNIELSNSIQEVEHIKIINKLEPIRREYIELEKKYNIYINEINKCRDVLNKKWKYEIYGTREEKEFLNIATSIFK